MITVTLVTWSPKARGLFLLAVPAFVWLSWYSFTTANSPSPVVGYLAIGMGVAAVIFQVHLGWYRVIADQEGIVERWLGGQRSIAWNRIRKVEYIAQTGNAEEIYRWSSSPEAAFHIIVHGDTARISVHRGMRGIDAFVAALRSAGVVDRDDPSVRPLMGPSPLNSALNQAYDVVSLFKVGVLVLPLSWIGGLLVVATTRFQLAGNLFVDGTLVALVPWALGFGVYRLVARVRAGRFGPDYARPPLGAKDAILTMAAAMGGAAAHLRLRSAGHFDTRAR
jgi:hypothetical protein